MVKRENERGMGDRRKNSGKKNYGLERQMGIDKTKENVLGERPRVCYCALML